MNIARLITELLAIGLPSGGAALSSAVSAIHPAYKFFIPGVQPAGSGDAKDASGNGANALILPAYTDAATWANAGYITTASGTDQSLVVPNQFSSFTVGTDSIILAGVINIATPGSTIALLGNTAGTANPGISLYLLSTGKLGVKVATSTVSQNMSSTGSSFVFADGTQHAFMVAIDGKTNQGSIWLDGMLSDVYNNVASGTPALSTSDFVIGGFYRLAGFSQTSYATKQKGIHLLIPPLGIPLNIGQIAQQHAATPLLPIKSSDMRYA